eukprot:Sspe_Gene.16677::Locus_5890_Transcript_1_1_Confidence_1.000_Length_2848::g.16677::m.16677/K18081/MTMR1_2; myotubularin-related protein 1/2
MDIIDDYARVCDNASFANSDANETGADWTVVAHNSHPWYKSPEDPCPHLPPPTLLLGERGVACIPSVSLIMSMSNASSVWSTVTGVKTGRLLLTNYRLILQPYQSDEGVSESPLDIAIGNIQSVDVDAKAKGQLAMHQKAVFYLMGNEWGGSGAKGWFIIEIRLRNGGVIFFASCDAHKETLAGFFRELSLPTIPLALMEEVRRAPPETSHWLDPAKGSPLARLLLEYYRMGISIPSHLLDPDCIARLPESQRENAQSGLWRLSEANQEFQLCSSYPPYLVVPSAVTDATLQASARFRAQNRLPVLSWRCPKTGFTISRSSQPLVGVFNQRSFEDESLVKQLRAASGASDKASEFYILDLRAKEVTIGNQLVRGGGHEAHAYYRCKTFFFNLRNIHSVSASLNAMHNLAQAQVTSSPLYPFQNDSDESENDQPNMAQHTKMLAKNGKDKYLSCLESSMWIDYIKALTATSLDISRWITDKHASVLVHCSDGWDRTAQVVSLAQLLLDPYSRTFDGFAALVEKDWVAMGHPFNDRITGIEVSTPFFNDAGLGDDFQGDVYVGGKQRCPSPIFVQWLACVAQLLEQHPKAFEFNTAYLWELCDLHSSGRATNFLFNNYQERYERFGTSSHPSVWDILMQRRSRFTNPEYAPELYDGPLRDFDNTARYMRPWIISDRKVSVAHENHLTAELKEKAEMLENQLKAESEKLAQLQRENSMLKRRYKEDVGHRIVGTVEAHPGGLHAQKVPILENKDDQQIVTGVRTESNNGNAEVEDSIVYVYQCKESEPEMAKEERPASPSEKWAEVFVDEQPSDGKVLVQGNLSSLAVVDDWFIRDTVP